LVAVGLSQHAAALDFGYLRGLQKGPIGDAPAFSEFKSLETEAAIDFRRAFGDTVLNNDEQGTKTAMSYAGSHLRVGGVYVPSETLTAIITGDVNVASDFDEERSRVAPHSRSDAGLYHHEGAATLVYTNQSLILGGGAALHVVGSEGRAFTYDGQGYIQDADSAAMPVFRGFVGYRVGHLITVLGARSFSQGESVVEAKGPAGEKYEYDIVRRVPGEFHIDGRLTLDNLQLAAGFGYILSGQASEAVDEFSLEFTTVEGSRKIRETGADRRNTDHWRLAFGGRYYANPDFAVLGGLTYTQASYAEDSFASLEHENLGGLRGDFGLDTTFGGYAIAAQVFYQPDQEKSYKEPASTRGLIGLARTQRPPINQGDEVDLRYGQFGVTLASRLQF
jgi:hypothetical protein